MSDLLERLFAFAERSDQVFASAESYLGFEVPYFSIFAPDGRYDHTYSQAGPPPEEPSNCGFLGLNLNYDYEPQNNSGGMTYDQFHEWDRQIREDFEEERRRPSWDSQPQLDDGRFERRRDFDDRLDSETFREMPTDASSLQEIEKEVEPIVQIPAYQAEMSPACIIKEEDATVEVPWPTVDVVENVRSPPYTPLPLASDVVAKSMNELPLASEVGSKILGIIHPSSKLTNALNINRAQSHPDEGTDPSIAESKVRKGDISNPETPRKKRKATDGEDPTDLNYASDSPPSAIPPKRTRRKKGGEKGGPRPIRCGNGLWRCLFGCTKSNGTMKTFTREFDAKRHMDWSCKRRLGQAEAQPGHECPVCHYKLSRYEVPQTQERTMY
ncbi:unnamed protein product [Cyclocybe aegerita]|uniref:Uncharacterized protein n=1 Tax=Cyclocybe aegerita TaxID=1973307 RepID=A0A8S0W5A3_CYCAE|nr:unnamed protein product [Cyclocybe aegerita]